jgi:hypothetical protein
MNHWPDRLRSTVLKLVGEDRVLAVQRMRTAVHVPTGTSGMM